MCIIALTCKIHAGVDKMKKGGSILRVLFVGCLMCSTNLAVAENKAAVRYLDVALDNCERGMRAAMPRSAIALRVLQRYQQKYQRYREAALTIAPALEQYSEPYEGEGDFFNDKTYSEALEACELQFTDKVVKAQTVVAKRLAQAKQKIKAQTKTREQRLDRSRTEISHAIGRNCLPYNEPPTMEMLSPKLKHQLNLDKMSFTLAIKKAQELYPAILQQTYQATNTSTGEAVKFNVEGWIDHCGKIFADYEASLIALHKQKEELEDQEIPEEDENFDEIPFPEDEEDAEGFLADEDLAAEEEDDEGPLPDDETEAMAPAGPEAGLPSMEDTGPEEEMDLAVGPTPEDEVPEEEIDEIPMEEALPEDEQEDEFPPEGEEDEFLNELRAAVKGDRLKVLQDMGKVPDFTDNDDNPERADIWQFENDDGTRCTVFTFKGNKVVSRKKPIKGECPEL